MGLNWFLACSYIYLDAMLLHLYFVGFLAGLLVCDSLVFASSFALMLLHCTYGFKETWVG